MPREGQRPVYASGGWEIDLGRRELRVGGAPVPLGSRAFEILELLVQSVPELVSKSDIFVRVWQRTHIEDNTLQFHISAIRRALGADREMLKTISGRGYQLLGDWTVRRQIGSGAPPELPLPSKPSIAVLAFQNMSDDPEQEYFADGVVEEIITALSRLRWLFVIARNSSFTYKGRAGDVKQIGRELGVRYVLEGSVRKAVNRVRISGQLVDAATGAHLWADRFDGGLEDIFDLQEQVTASVVGAIAPTGTGRNRTVEAQADRESRRLRLFSARRGGCPSRDAGREQRGAAAFPPRHRTRPRVRVRLWPGGWVLYLAQSKWLDRKPETRGCRDIPTRSQVRRAG